MYGAVVSAACPLSLLVDGCCVRAAILLQYAPIAAKLPNRSTAKMQHTTAITVCVLVRCDDARLSADAVASREAAPVSTARVLGVLSATAPPKGGEGAAAAMIDAT